MYLVYPKFHYDSLLGRCSRSWSVVKAVNCFRKKGSSLYIWRSPKYVSGKYPNLSMFVYEFHWKNALLCFIFIGSIWVISRGGVKQSPKHVEAYLGKSHRSMMEVFLQNSIRDVLHAPKYASHYIKSVRIRSYSGPHFPTFSTFGINMDSVYLFVFSPNEGKCGKMRTRMTPNTDTFYAVSVSNRYFK